jgi:hypothetical protein
MADIQLIINSLTTISNAVYQGAPSSRQTLAETAFNRLKGSAQQVATILQQNQNPNNDMIENLEAQFTSMGNDVGTYITKRQGVENILLAWNKAKYEWDLLKQGL